MKRSVTDASLTVASPGDGTSDMQRTQALMQQALPSYPGFVGWEWSPASST